MKRNKFLAALATLVTTPLLSFSHLKKGFSSGEIFDKNKIPQKTNEIAKENSKTLGVVNFWTLVSRRDTSIEGFPTQLSVNNGETINFMIDSKNSFPYKTIIYRLGYYGGKGAIKKGIAKSIKILNQIESLPDPTNGNLIDCKKTWSITDKWEVPIDALSGVYIAHLVCEKTGDINHILFIVRNDQVNSEIMFKTSDPTWQAYNRYKNLCLYPSKKGQAQKVSYNRPMTQDTISNDYFFASEYRMLRWLERNGYNVKYCTALDIVSKKSINEKKKKYNFKILLSVGHDEYWSKEERDYFETAKNNGIHLAFFSGNECYWKTRWEDATTLVCYKEGFENGNDETNGHYSCKSKCDPAPGSWTGLWRNLKNSMDETQAECALSGQLSWVQTINTHTINVPKHFRNHRFWRNTKISKLEDEDISLLPGLLGYEWNYYQANFATSYPTEIEPLSEVSVDMIVSTKPPNITHFTHKLSLYKTTISNALIFGAGTTNWSLGLDNLNSDYEFIWPYIQPTDINVQQATMNLFYDMGGVLPFTKQRDLVDH